MSGITEVNLVGNLKILSESRPEQKVDVIGLSLGGAYIRSLTSQSIGDQILLHLKMEESIELKGKIKKQSKTRDSQPVFFVSFDQLDQVQHQALEEITNYYLKLKKAGVHLEGPLEEGQSIP